MHAEETLFPAIRPDDRASTLERVRTTTINTPIIYMSSPEEKPLGTTEESLESDGVVGSAIDTVSDTTEKNSTSTWFALRNPVFCRLWFATLLSGTFVSSQDVTATWLLDYLGASPYLLSLMATAASAPFFLFTLPAGAIADIVNRRTVIVSAVLWQAAWSVILAFGAWTDVLNPGAVLACVFALGIGLAFGAPVWGAVVPDIVRKNELPSAITLGGVQLNLSGIVGPALGGLLLPLLGAPLLISLNAVAFLLVALVIMQWKPSQTAVTRLRESFTESFISSLRYARNSQRMKMILFRNVLFSVVISVIPALLPVIALRNCACSASQLGLIFACVGVGSLAGAVFVLPYLRQRVSTNAITSISMATMVLVLCSMAVIRDVPTLMVSTTFAGVAWALAGSELWVAGQRVMPGWVRGRMNAFLIMLGQGGMALGAIFWATGVANIGIDLTFAAAAAVALVALALGHRFSINFATEAKVEEAPLEHARDLAVLPDHDDGPITITTDYLIANEDREQFGILMQEVQAAFRRNGAFQCRLDENLDQLGLFRLEYHVSTWAEHLRLHMRMTVDETKVYKEARNLHAGDSEPIVRHFRSTQRFIQLPGFGFSGRTFMNTSRMPRPRLVAAASGA
jgi:MFS family permease